MKEREVFCAVCGQKFTTTAINHKYCGKKCAKQAEYRQSKEKRKPVPIFRELTCKKCGKAYRGHFNSRYCDACLDVGGQMHMLRDRRRYREEDLR